MRSEGPLVKATRNAYLLGLVINIGKNYWNILVILSNVL